MKNLDLEARKRLKKLIIYISVALGTGIAYYLIIRLTGFGIPCWIHLLTGFNCPGCGITRMFVALIGGDIVSAFRYNALVLILLPFAIGYGIYSAAVYVKNGSVKTEGTAQTVVFSVLLVITLAFGILRNTSLIPWIQ